MKRIPDVFFIVFMLIAAAAVATWFVPGGAYEPLSDLSGITRQTAVLIYQLGDGFTNMIIPTSGVTIGTLAMAKIPYERWFRWNLPVQVMFVLLSLGLLIWPVMTGWT